MAPAIAARARAAYAHAIGGRVYRFDGFMTLLAKASPARSRDFLAGVAAASDEERKAAKLALADLPPQQVPRRSRRSLGGRRGHAPDRGFQRRRVQRDRPPDGRRLERAAHLLEVNWVNRSRKSCSITASDVSPRLMFQSCPFLRSLPFKTSTRKQSVCADPKLDR